MSAIANSIQHFLRDQTPRLAPVPLQPRARRREEEQKSSAAPLLLTGVAAALYVAARMGLAYTAIGH
jgi:hypothetical protein